MDYEIKEIDLNDRCEDPADNDVEVLAIEVSFAIPSYITQDQQRRLNDLLDEITRSPKNTPKEGVHWVSSNGAKPNFSAIDAALLGVQPGDNPPANGGEPTFDETVLCFGTSARSFNSERERLRELKRRSSK
jgi:hypothetical protein